MSATNTQLPLHKILSQTRGFKMALLNVNGLLAHIDELSIAMFNQPTDLLAINETKLDGTISNSLVNLTGYEILRNDRNRSGGGVCFYIRNSINYRIRTDLSDQALEMIALEIRKPHSRPFLVINWYRPPKTSINCFECFERIIQQADKQFDEIYILGDLNCNLMLNTPENHTKHLKNLIDVYQLSQLITEPTRITSTSKSLIDLFITNNEDRIVKSGVYPLSISDHNLIYGIRKIGIPRKQPKHIRTRTFKHFVEKDFLQDLTNADWPDLNKIDNIDTAWSSWKDTFITVVDKHAPIRTIRTRNKPAAWISSELKQQMFARDALKRKACKSGTTDDWIAFRKKRNEVNLCIKKSKAKFYRNSIDKNVQNPRKTWKILNDLIGRKSNITEINEILTYSSVSINDSQQIANEFNKYFATIGLNLASDQQSSSVEPDVYLTQCESEFKLKKIVANDVLKLMKNVDITKATGLDGISNKILKISAPLIYEDLALLFNKSIESNIFPDEWKMARVTPIFKSGNKAETNNYRPISVISAIARLFERLIYNQLYAYLTKNKLLNPKQSGFRSLHSTVTALLELTNDWCFNIDRGMVSGVIFLDLKKAFDTVDHSILLNKLKYFGFVSPTIKWFNSYLSGRYQRCFVNGMYSDSELLTCGVPQGSILGPLLFLIYINDLTTCLKYGRGRMYADDTNLTFSSRDPADLQKEMGYDLKCITTWLLANKLTLNILKTEYMLIGSRQRIATIVDDVLNLSINEISLQRVNQTKCLGVTLDSHLTWEVHINSIIKKVVSSLAILKKAKKFVKIKSLCNIYHSIIEPYFDYCGIVWDGIGIELSKKLQRLQNRAARIITGDTYLTHSSKDTFQKLGWSKLNNRRLEQKAIMMFKIVNGLTPKYLQEMFHNNIGMRSYNLRNTVLNFDLPVSKTDYYRNSFAFTGAKLWNLLTEELKCTHSLETFKRKLKMINLHQLLNVN